VAPNYKAALAQPQFFNRGTQAEVYAALGLPPPKAAQQ
jgi:hypothetical protein